MKASNWEFSNRAMLFGLIFGIAFPLYAHDHQNSAAALSNWLAPRLRMDADSLTRLLLFVSAGLVADGPYRRVRNPLYFGNVILAIGMGAMMSRAGFAFAVVAMFVFCYRLILREEAGLLASQGQAYDRYRQAVPRLLLSPWPRIPSAGQTPRWRNGFMAELWSWGFAASVLGFAITLRLPVFFAILGVSLVIFWVGSTMVQKRAKASGSDRS